MSESKFTSLDQLSRNDKESVKIKKLFMLDINKLVLPKEYNIRYAGLGYDEYWNQEHVKNYVSDLARNYADGDVFPPLVVKFNAETQNADRLLFHPPHTSVLFRVRQSYEHAQWLPP